jgi:uncharacterized protein involved in exopolysaccharide biosynthesis
MQNEESDSGLLNLSDLKNRVLRNWKWVFLSISLSLSTAYFYLRYTIPIFESRASILVMLLASDNKELSILKELNLPVANRTGTIRNEIEVIKSQNILEALCNKLKLYQQFFLMGTKTGIQRKEIYDESPVDLSYYHADSLIVPRSAQKFSIQFIDESSFQITFNNQKTEKRAFGDKIWFPDKQEFLIVRRTVLMNNFWYGKTMEVIVNTLPVTIAKLRSAIFVGTDEENSPSVVNLGISGTNQSRNLIILDELIKEYERDGIKERNRIGFNASSFIEERLKLIQVELSELEKQTEQFKSKNRLMDVQLDASSVLARGTENEKRITNNEIQQSLIDYLLNYIEKTNGFNDLLPSNLGLSETNINVMTG